MQDRRELVDLLRQEGMDPTRISELVTVAESPAEIWAEYKGGAISFREALNRARKAKKK
jgi:hypothetical protein